jgi:CheY-like chemotaxis protein
MRVLIVDDDPATRRALTGLLEADGFDVTAASNSLEALARLENETAWDALVTDHVMPGMPGLELAKRARALWPAIRTIVVSCYPPHVETKGISWMLKPIDPELLSAALREPEPPTSSVMRAAPGARLASGQR